MGDFNDKVDLTWLNRFQAHKNSSDSIRNLNYF